ncbi:hypothetical protein F5B20DRAFT_320949 [Whalleya microplaca]|nr:hypothetical protein F5B20DRAFT_320949 [Whalleya microplaca]
MYLTPYRYLLGISTYTHTYHSRPVESYDLMTDWHSQTLTICVLFMCTYYYVLGDRNVADVLTWHSARSSEKLVNVHVISDFAMLGQLRLVGREANRGVPAFIITQCIFNFIVITHRRMARVLCTYLSLYVHTRHDRIKSDLKPGCAVSSNASECTHTRGQFCAGRQGPSTPLYNKYMMRHLRIGISQDRISLVSNCESCTLASDSDPASGWLVGGGLVLASNSIEFA